MNVLRSRGEPDLIYVLLSDSEAKALRNALRRSVPLGRNLRRRLKEVLRGNL